MGCRRVRRLVAQRQVQKDLKVQHRVPKGQKVPCRVRKNRKVLRRGSGRYCTWSRRSRRHAPGPEGEVPTGVAAYTILGMLVLPSPLEIRLLADLMEWGSGSGCRGYRRSGSRNCSIQNVGIFRLGLSAEEMGTNSGLEKHW
jgi:hypothetical protein